jgi:DNA-binding MarR family transcriptional regulator
MLNEPDELILPFFNIFKLLKGKMRDFSHIALSITEVGALHYVNRKGEATMKELSEFLGITPPSTTAVIDKMIKLNFLKRSLNEDDRRNVILSFTDKGKEMFLKARIEKIKIIKNILSGLNEKERLELCRIFKKILKEQI